MIAKPSWRLAFTVFLEFLWVVATREQCPPGFYGISCDRPCKNCLEECDKSTGRCERCAPGYYGDYCNQTCPKTCLPKTSGVIECGKESGECLGGCQEGWFGDMCHRECSTSCVGSCKQRSGECMTCVAGWWDTDCRKDCPAGCGGNGSCHLPNGECADGCKPGYSGENCNCSPICMNCFCERCSDKCNPDIDVCYQKCEDKCEHCPGRTFCSLEVECPTLLQYQTPSASNTIVVTFPLYLVWYVCLIA